MRQQITQYLKPAGNVMLNVAIPFFLSVFLVSCSTVLGPPGSESDVMQGQTGSFQHDAFFDGQPDISLMKVEGGYYLWRTGNTWHVRVARADRFRFETPGRPTIYSGRISVEKGIIFDLLKQNTDIINDVRLAQQAVVFRFDLRNDVEGFDFSVKPFGPQYCVKFDLQRNKERVQGIVHLGRTMFVPDTVPLETCVY